jgi:hypothetical protein
MVHVPSEGEDTVPVSLRLGASEWSVTEEQRAKLEKEYARSVGRSRWLTAILRVVQCGNMELTDIFRSGLADKIDLAVINQILASIATIKPEIIAMVNPVNLQNARLSLDLADRIRQQTAKSALAAAPKEE